MKLASIPSLTVRPVGAEPSEIRGLLTSRAIGRRGILKGATGAAMVLGISALDLLPGRNKAYASIMGSSPWRYWGDCSDYDTWQEEDWDRCNPEDAVVSEGLCQPDHPYRHRTGTRERDGCAWTDYDRDERCTGDNGTTINAWRWHKSEGSSSGPSSVSCSDGKVHYQVHPDCTTTSYNSTCRHYIN